MPLNPGDDLYAVYCGEINAANTQQLVKGLTFAQTTGTPRIHLLFQTWGGFVGDGIFISNLLKNLPLEVVLYNAGQVASAGVIAYLGAKTRIATTNSMFMIHRCQNNAIPGTVAKMQAATKSLILDDARCEAILRQRAKLPEETWQEITYHDVYFSGEDAVKHGIATQIGEFSPPAGTQVLNAIG